MAVCINCHIILQPNHQRNEYLAVDLNEDYVLIVEEWCGREISNNDRLCQECVYLIIQEANNHIADPHYLFNRQLGHVCVCISCGISLSRRTGRRRHKLIENSVERKYLENQIFPRQIPIEAWACNACWMRCYRNVHQSQQLKHVVNADTAELEVPVDDHVFQPTELNLVSTRPSRSVTIPRSETSSRADQVPRQISTSTKETIHLLNYTRTPDTPNHCFVPDCVNTERLRVPRNLKRSILFQHKIYVTQSARVCQEHSMLFNWDILNEYEFPSNFNAIDLENMLNLLRTTPAGCVLKC